MQVRLEVSHKSGKKKTVNIHSDAVIGRSNECSLRIASSEISRKHCKLTVMESGVLVRDLASANGTWVDGKMIPPDRDVALTPGSKLSIGPVQFIVHFESSNPAIEPPGSTVELLMLSEGSGSNADPTPVAAAADDVAEPLPADDLQSPDNDQESLATVVVEPDTIEQALAESFDDDVPETETVETAEAVEATEVDDAEAVEVEAAEVAEAVDEQTAEVAEPVAEGKRGSMFGGLLKLGRKSKGKPAQAASPVPDVVTETNTAAEVADAVAAGEADAQFADEGDYSADDEEPDEEYEDEGEADPELGDFFSQFDQ